MSSFKENWWIYAIILIAIGGTILLVKSSQKTDISGVRVLPLLQDAANYVGTAPTKGSGKVTLVEFSDYECPYCGKFYQEIEIRLEEEYKDKVQFVFKDYPLDMSCNENLQRPIHTTSCDAAIAAHCAHDQGKFWQYHDILFQHQNAQTRLDLITYAETIALNMTQFTSCLDSKNSLEDVKKDIKEGTNIGITGTPAILIGKKAIVGFYSYDIYKQFIEEELKIQS